MTSSDSSQRSAPSSAQARTTLPEGLQRVQVWVDGEPADPATAKVSVFDRGFLYGDSIFETLRTYGGRPFALPEHLERLKESARRVWIDLPVPLEQFDQEIRQAVEQSGYEECYVRVMVTRGLGALGLDPGLAHSPLRVTLVGPLTKPPSSFYEDGIEVVSFETSRAGDATEAAGAKIGNYLVAVLANRKAVAAGAKEALISDSEGRVVEGATSNVFWLKGGQLLTPPLDAGILAGITRANILTVAEAEGLQVVYRIPTVAELQAADEVFISSSIRELVPVVKIDGQAVSGGQPGKQSLRLLEQFRATCQVAAAQGR